MCVRKQYITRNSIEGAVGGIDFGFFQNLVNIINHYFLRLKLLFIDVHKSHVLVYERMRTIPLRRTDEKRSICQGYL